MYVHQLLPASVKMPARCENVKINSETNKGNSCFVNEDNKFPEYYGKKNGKVCFRCTAKTCKTRIETNDVIVVAGDRDHSDEVIAMLQLLRYEILANVELRKKFPSVRPRSFGLHYSPLSLHQLTMLRFWSYNLRFH